MVTEIADQIVGRKPDENLAHRIMRWPRFYGVRSWRAGIDDCTKPGPSPTGHTRIRLPALPGHLLPMHFLRVHQWPFKAPD